MGQARNRCGGSCVTSGQLHGFDLGPEGPLSRIVLGTCRCSMIFPGQVGPACLRMRDDGGIRFESLRLSRTTSEAALQLFILRALQIYTDNRIHERAHFWVQSLRD